MVFEIILENPFEFQQIFKTIAKITDCFNMEFNDEGIFIQTMDNSHISLISTQLKPEYFTEYDVTDNHVLGISSKVITKILKNCTRKNKLTIRLDVSGDKLLFTFEDTCCVITLFLNLLDIETEAMGIPEYEPEVSLQFNTQRLKDIMNKISVYDPSNIQFKTRKQILWIKSNTDETDIKIRLKESIVQPKIKINNKKVKKVEEFKFLKASENIKSTYPFPHMNSFIQSIIPNYTFIHLSNDFPLAFHCPLKEGSFMKYYLSPKIDD